MPSGPSTTRSNDLKRARHQSERVSIHIIGFAKVMGDLIESLAKRAVLAEHEWARMKKNDSQECRNCHNFAYMDYAEQNQRSAKRHQEAFNAGLTCIDCHKGIAHTLPEIEQNIGAPKEHAAVPPPVQPATAAASAP